MQQRFLLGDKRVEPRRDDPLHRLGQRQLFAHSPLGEHAHVLLGIQRIATGTVEQCALQLGLEQRPFAQPRDQPRGLIVREWSERDVRGVQLPAAPSRATFEQVEPRRTEDEHRDVAHPVGEMLDEVEQAVVGPLDVLEHEHDGVLLGERLEEPPPRDEGLLLRARGITGLTDERTEMRQHPFRVFVDQLLDCTRELRLHVLVGVRL